MFSGQSNNEYEEIVVKATDENLTTENWEINLVLCDKVQDEGTEGAHNVIAAILKRLMHRNPNVQLYALTLSETLSKNCGIELHREIASRAFTQGLEKIITDRMTHDKVKKKALSLVAMWTAEFENDSTLGVMEDCYNNLKSKNFKFEAPQEAPPPAVDDEVRRKEEEELQRVLELSIQDKGGRNQWHPSSSSSGGAGSSSSAGAASSSAVNASSSSSGGFKKPTYQAGYVPARTPSPKQPPRSSTAMPPAAATPSAANDTPTVASLTAQGNTPTVTRVRALHTFEPTEPGELAFDKGDVIKVVDRGYKDWWRGQLKGRTGIFPVNYVEPLPEPTAAELAKEAEQEATVFTQAANVDKLLTMLRQMDPNKDNLADNEEVQELYRSSMALRPKVVKLIDKYSQKRADLVSMNETFLRAKNIFDRMMEESIARHTGVYDQPSYRPPFPQQPDPRGPEYGRTPAPYGWGPSGYDQPGRNGFSSPAPAFQGPLQQRPQQIPQQQQQYGPQGQPAGYPQGYTGQSVSTPYGPQGSVPHPNQPQNLQPQQQQGPQGEPNPNPQLQPQGFQQAIQQLQQQQQSQPQGQPQPQSQSQPPLGQGQGPLQGQPSPIPPQANGKYVYDPNGTYTEPNVQAWAKYYSQGGKELAGAVYFVSIPGVTDGSAGQPGSQSPQAQQQQQLQQQQQKQAQQQPAATGRQGTPQSADSGEYPYAAQLAQQLAENGPLTPNPYEQLPDPRAGGYGFPATGQQQARIPNAYQGPSGGPAGYTPAPLRLHHDKQQGLGGYSDTRAGTPRAGEEVASAGYQLGQGQVGTGDAPNSNG